MWTAFWSLCTLDFACASFGFLIYSPFFGLYIFVFIFCYPSKNQPVSSSLSTKQDILKHNNKMATCGEKMKACCSGPALKSFFQENKLLLFTVLSVVLGIGVGFGMQDAGFSKLDRSRWEELKKKTCFSSTIFDVKNAKK